ncbi:MAG: WD40 repeat domain-containing protein [Thermoguttaceae bacterium]
MWTSRVLYAAFVSLLTTTASAVELKAVAVSPDRTTIAAGGAGGLVCVWDAKTGKKTQAFMAKAAVHGLGFVRDAKTLVVGTDGACVGVWTAGEKGYVQTKEFGGAEMLYGLTVSPDSNDLAISVNTGWVYFYDTNSWDQTGVLFESSNFISALAFAPDGQSLATAGNSFSVWNLGAGSTLRKPRGDRDFNEIKSTSLAASRWNHGGGVPMQDPYCTDIAFSPDGKRVAGTTGVGRLDSGGKRVRLWEADTGKPVWEGRGTGMLSVAFTADGRSVITGSDDGVLRVWNPSSSKLVRDWRGHGKAVRQIVPFKSATFVSAGEDGAVVLWDTAGRELMRFPTD